MWSLFLSGNPYLSGIKQGLWYRGNSLVRETKHMQSTSIFKGGRWRGGGRL